tara:strand:+ start:208 stop:474 length:267 start_codon:yes stop_codon:yes gene_type:complete
MSEKRIKLIQKSLQCLEPIKISIEDEGHLHVGHAGARAGGHFKLYIVSDAFKDKNMIDRHKLIYQTLGELMKTDIHALSIKALSGDEC